MTLYFFYPKGWNTLNKKKTSTEEIRIDSIGFTS